MKILASDYYVFIQEKIVLSRSLLQSPGHTDSPPASFSGGERLKCRPFGTKRTSKGSRSSKKASDKQLDLRFLNHFAILAVE